MGANWRTTATVIMTMLQIQALIGVKTKVTGVEGQSFDFICEYEDGYENRKKSFCHVKEDGEDNCLILTNKQNQWETNGRFSLFDNTTETIFIVRVDRLIPEDSGTYRCEVDIRFGYDVISIIQLNVTPAIAAERSFHPTTVSPISERKPKMDGLHLPLYATAVMCVGAMLTVCLFTLCLLLAVKQGRSGQRQTRETSSDYETMMPGVGGESELRCTCSAPDCRNLSSLPSPTPDICNHLPQKHRESNVTLGVVEYVNVVEQGHTCQYQHLDLNQLEDHVYHCLNVNSEPKDGCVQVKEQTDCSYCERVISG